MRTLTSICSAIPTLISKSSVYETGVGLKRFRFSGRSLGRILGLVLITGLVASGFGGRSPIGHVGTVRAVSAASESVSTFASDCVTPKTDFNLGDTVCAKVTGGLSAKALNWVSRTDSVVQVNNITSDPQTFTFTLPASDTSTLSGTGVDDVTVDNRGVWRVYTASEDNSVRSVAFFTVHAATPFVDLSVYQDASVPASSVDANSSSTFDIFITNNGPDDAQGVQLLDTLPANTTFVSLVDSSSTFTCSPPDGGTATCTAATLAAGATVKLTFAYQVNSGTPAGTLITNSVGVSSTTAELEPGDNNASFNAVVPTATGPSTCTFDCPDNITATATSQSGAVVNYPSATNIVGTCGAVSANPPSGSVFPVGTTIVHVSSDAGTSCSFTVTVVTTPAPTITCPPDKSTSADQSGTATVDPGTPTTTPTSGVTVTGARSDGLQLTAPYPTGETGITWTVLDSVGRTATCEQKINVLPACPANTPPPTIAAPADITAFTGSGSTNCGAIVDQLGTPTTSSDCSVTVNSSGIPPGNFFPVGTTHVVYTVTDGNNHSASATQNVTVIDNTPPIIVAPPDASYVCPSQVPAGNPTQAHGINPDLPNGGPPTDNCGAPVVTVSDTSTGAGNASSPLVITRRFTATDVHGNTSIAIQTITVIDSTPPVITCPANVVVNLPLNSSATSMVVSYSAPTATDNCGVSVTSTPASGSVFPVGTTVVTATATDTGGNVSTCTFTVTVLYDFTGFFSPVGNPPTLNVVNAGRAIPVKFSLSGNKGLNIFAAGSPASGTIPCDASAPPNDVTETVTAGSSSLSYDASSDQYIYVWATNSSWAGTCRQLVVTLNDGSTHVANFKFK